MRLFFAMQLPPDVFEKLHPVAGKADHFTLAFLGETERVDDACAAASEVRGAPFEVAIAGAGAFPSPSRPRVLWLGVTGGAQPMIAVANALCAALRARGFALEDRPFRPHLTIGRVRPGGEKQARRTLESVPPGELARFVVSEFCLVQSVLGAGGAKHTVLRRFPLADS